MFALIVLGAVAQAPIEIRIHADRRFLMHRVQEPLLVEVANVSSTIVHMPSHGLRPIYEGAGKGGFLASTGCGALPSCRSLNPGETIHLRWAVGQTHGWPGIPLEAFGLFVRFEVTPDQEIEFSRSAYHHRQVQVRMLEQHSPRPECLDLLYRGPAKSNRILFEMVSSDPYVQERDERIELDRFEVTRTLRCWDRRKDPQHSICPRTKLSHADIRALVRSALSRWAESDRLDDCWSDAGRFLFSMDDSLGAHFLEELKTTLPGTTGARMAAKLVDGG